MLIDLTEERGGAHLDLRWGKDRHCYFPLFSFLKPLPLPQMCILYGIMWIGKKVSSRDGEEIVKEKRFDFYRRTWYYTWI